MAAEAASTIERAGHPGIEHLRDGALRCAGAPCCQRAKDGIGAGAGCVLWSTQQRADGVRRGPGPSICRGPTPYAACPDQDIAAERRVEQPWSVDQRVVSADLRG